MWIGEEYCRKGLRIRKVLGIRGERLGVIMVNLCY